MFAADAEPQQAGRKVGLAGNGHSALDGRLDAAQARGVANYLHRSADGVGALGAALHVEGHDGAEAGHEAAGRRVARVVGAAGVANDLHSGMLREALGEFGGRGARTLEAQGERAHAAHSEVGLERTGRGPRQLAALARLARALVGRRDHGSEQQIGVPAQVLRGRVHDQIGAQRQRPLEQRRGERAVDHHQRVRLARRGADGR
jgi:hypothetical protein